MIFKRGRAAVDASLFVQVLALMAGALIVAQATNLIVLYYGPQPQPEVHATSEIVRAYMAEPPVENRPALVALNVKTPPPGVLPPRGFGYYRDFRREIITGIAAAKGPTLEPTDILIKNSDRRWFGDRSAVRISRAPIGPNTPNERFIIAPFKVAIHQPDGTWRVIENPAGFRLDPLQQRALLTFFVTSIVALIAAYLFTRRLTKPFTSLAESAERLGRDPGAPQLSVTGPREARAASRAFNNMQERLRRYVEDRTAMIGAIAHDLRTPLTRLRFRIESLPDDQKAKMSSDLDQMEAMLSATMSFVRDATQQTQRTKLELSSVLESLADEMTDTGSDVKMEHADKVIVEGDPVALKRLFSNLLENAVKYGKRARVRVFREGDHATVEVDDDGPGVPAGDLERVFEPFFRREPSRNRDTGGIGLGLAVVRTVARALGGDAELINRAGGGLTARVSLPI